MSWDDLAARMDEKVDEHLGDAIYISFDQGATYDEVKGFYTPTVGGQGLEGFDEILGSRPRLKLRKTLFPGEREPSHEMDRFRSAKMGAFVYRPSGSNPDEQGRYFIFDVQRAP